MSEPEPRLGGRLGTMTDFWQWAFGDLRSNNVRGVFAEWLVAQLLGLKPGPRGSWDDYDILLPDGRTVEVKASAYVQAWHVAGSAPSVIQFSGLKGNRWIEAEKRHAAEATFNADLYVFCVHIEKDASLWSAFDLDQWRFYVVPRQTIADRDSMTLRLSTVAKLASQLTAIELAAAVFKAR